MARERSFAEGGCLNLLYPTLLPYGSWYTSVPIWLKPYLNAVLGVCGVVTFGSRRCVQVQLIEAIGREEAGEDAIRKTLITSQLTPVPGLSA